MDRRGVSPVVGVILMVALTIVLASMIAVALPGLVDLDLADEQSEDLLDGEDPIDDGPHYDGALVPVKDPGDEPRSGDDPSDDVLELRVENTRDEDVTVEAFAVDATGLDPDVTIDDGNAPEFDVQRTDAQEGEANREDGGAETEFDADGTRYHVVDDTDDGQVAVVGADVTDAEIDVRKFSRSVGTLAFVEDADDADVTLELVLDDGSVSAFYFENT